MRILQATDCYPPPIVGGRDLHVRMLSQELAQRGHDVEVITLAGPAGPRIEMDGDVRVHRMAGWSRVLNRLYADPQRPFHPTVPDPGLARAFAALVREWRPQVVHAHSWIVHSLLPFLPSEETRLVVTMHEYGAVCPKNTFVHGDGVCSGPAFRKCLPCASAQYGPARAVALTSGLRLMRSQLRHVDRFIAVSAPVAEACADLVPDGPAIEVIPPFLPDESFPARNVARPSFVPATGDYIMFAGALGAHKGVDTLLEAWAGLRPRVPLLLVGLPHPDATRLRFEGVTIVEDIPHEAVVQAFAHSAMVVVPSRWPDPSPMVALEAMAAGRPVVASAVGGLPGLVVDGTTGMLVPPGDTSALRAGIQRLLEDSALRADMGKAARLRAASFSADAVLPALEQIYREAVAFPHKQGV